MAKLEHPDQELERTYDLIENGLKRYGEDRPGGSIEDALREAEDTEERLQSELNERSLNEDKVEPDQK